MYDKENVYSSKVKFGNCALRTSIKKQNKMVYETDVAALCIQSVISEDTDNITFCLCWIGKQEGSRDMDPFVVYKRAVEHVLDTHPLSRLKLLFIQPASVSMKSREQVCLCVHEKTKANCM